MPVHRIADRPLQAPTADRPAATLVTNLAARLLEGLVITGCGVAGMSSDEGALARGWVARLAEGPVRPNR